MGETCIRNEKAVESYAEQFPLECWYSSVLDMNDVGIEAESTDPKELGIMLPKEWCRNLQTPSVQSSCVLNFSFGVQ